MPRKVSYGVDFDDDYDGYDDDYEEYEDEYEVAGNVETPEPKPEVKKSSVWCCSICTYDNDESLSACDICGVIRNPTTGNYNNGDKKTAGSVVKDFGVSILAKSLFAPLPHQTARKVEVGPWQNDDFVGGCSFRSFRNFGGNFHEIDKAFSSLSHPRVNIAPFKFDVPSPDDLVSSGLHFSKGGSKANSLSIKPPKVSSGISEKNGAVNVKPTVNKPDNSSLLTEKGKHGDRNEWDSLTSGVVSIQSGSKDLNGSSASLPKGKLHIQSGDETLDRSSSSMAKGKNRSVDDSSSTSINERRPGSVSSNLNSMSLSDKSGISHNVNAGRAKSLAHYEPEKWIVPDEAEDTLTQLNLAIVGHVDSGKSTLSGRLLHLLGRITQKEMRKYEKEAKIQGKGSFAYAWALDMSPEERERGITMTVAVAYFDSKRYHVVVLDSPGHKDFVPNLISGATQADAAILVIDASNGAFEAGMDSTWGQTREHAQLIRSFGVDQIIVAVNKMDVVDYSKDRFDLIKSQLGIFLRSCGFKDSSVSWVPLSAMENQNLVASPSDVRLLSWFHGPHLLEAIDSLQPPTRDLSKPLLMPICDVIKSAGQISANGKLEAGALRSGLKVLLMPSGEVGTVRSLERDSQSCTIARAGDNVAVSLLGVEESNVIPGGVLCHPDFPVAVAQQLELKVLILDHAKPILIGSQLEFHIHHAKEAARVVRITSLLDPKTGKVIKKSPRCLTSKQSAVLEVALSEPVCVEEFSSSRALGRVFLRALGRTVAVGIDVILSINVDCDGCSVSDIDYFLRANGSKMSYTHPISIFLVAFLFSTFPLPSVVHTPICQLGVGVLVSGP
ncbi:hypothetical protein Tsubulata_026886 [Turnera subulata]|uniref:Tr-type G domain-containing protein n=1 Tax=Turnera subulata TaxID=218843 RepID=A0A9Q0FNI4_9ROSI|nr:hypothetical protein Tsubulata_026886 [Turnera subulata]